jgi:hypothetical protein
VNPFVFFVGCPRSGTTLVRRMVDAHPQIAMTPETHWVVETFERRMGLTDDGLATPELLRNLEEEERFMRLEPDIEALERLIAGAPISYADFVTAVFDGFGRAHGKPLVGDKTPGYAFGVRMLGALWPHTRIVHIVRDGRDVCLSAINWKRKLPSLERRFPTWRSEAVATAALWWAWHARAAHEDGRTLGTRFYELRYERLVAEPEATCAALCEFLGVPYHDAMVRFHEGRTKSKPGLDAKHAWLPVTPALRDWRMQMPREDVARFEAAAGDLLEELGYARAFPRLPEKTRELADATREAFAEETGQLVR